MKEGEAVVVPVCLLQSACSKSLLLVALQTNVARAIGFVLFVCSYQIDLFVIRMGLGSSLSFFQCFCLLPGVKRRAEQPRRMRVHREHYFFTYSRIFERNTLFTSFALTGEYVFCRNEHSSSFSLRSLTLSGVSNKGLQRK